MHLMCSWKWLSLVLLTTSSFDWPFLFAVKRLLIPWWSYQLLALFHERLESYLLSPLFPPGPYWSLFSPFMPRCSFYIYSIFLHHLIIPLCCLHTSQLFTHPHRHTNRYNRLGSPRRENIQFLISEFGSPQYYILLIHPFTEQFYVVFFFNSWKLFHSVFVLHFHHPFISWWTSRVAPFLCYQ